MENQDKVNAFLSSMGMGSGTPEPPASSVPKEANAKKPEPECAWDKIIKPKSCNMILGDVGAGKSGLAYFLLERYSQKYNLTPAVVGIPRNKRSLLPDNIEFLDGPDDVKNHENVIVLIDEADKQIPFQNLKMREQVTDFLMMYRQREMIMLLAFHYPRLVLSTYLPSFSTFLLKRPPYLIEFASKSKGDTLYQLMMKAEERFADMVPPGWEPDEDQMQPLEVIRNTFVVAPRIRYQGMLVNPTPSYWSDELSKIWAGKSESSKPSEPNYSTGLMATNEHTPISPKMVAWAVQKEPPNEEHPDTSLWLDPFTNIEWYK